MLGEFRHCGRVDQAQLRDMETLSESTGVEFKSPPLLKLTHGRILAHVGRLDETREKLTEAMDGLLSAEPFVWAPTAKLVLFLYSYTGVSQKQKNSISHKNFVLIIYSCKFTIGRLLMFEGDTKPRRACC